MTSELTEGEKWIKFLRSYGPVPNDKAQEIEHLDKLSKRLKIPPLQFPHPKEEELGKHFLTKGLKKVALVTGTAGDGKTSLCLNLIEKLSGIRPKSIEGGGIHTFTTIPRYGGEPITVIYDVSGWRQRDENGHLKQSCVDTLEKAARYAKNGEGEATILAVNDGQLHETHKALPKTASDILKSFFKQLVAAHAIGSSTCPDYPNASLINLSSVLSEELMELCLDCLLSRSEWQLLEIEKNDDPKRLFGPNCHIHSNLQILKRLEVRTRLSQVATIAEASGYHLPVRSIFILIVNAILGHSKFQHKLVSPGVEVARVYPESNRFDSSFHLNFFGLNLGRQARSKRILYHFLASLRIGHETINDIDELIIFGKKHPTLRENYEYIFSHDQGQQDPELKVNISKYLLGDIDQDEDIELFRDKLSEERKRLFFSSHAMERGYDFWRTSVLHNAESYINDYLKPCRLSKAVDPKKLAHLTVGLNRVWTGLLISPATRELFITSGLDLTTAPISDLLVQRLAIDESHEYISAEISPRNRLQLVVHKEGLEDFRFELTVLRFEFLMRVAQGAMPTSFSKEIYSDFLSLKQKAIQNFNTTTSSSSLKLIDLDDSGGVKTTPIHLP